MQLIFNTTSNGLHSVTLENNGKPVKGFLSRNFIKVFNKGQEWLKRAAICKKINLN